MLIKVCGMREPENIKGLMQLDVDLMGMIFWPKSPRCVKNVHVNAGIVPDIAQKQVTQATNGAKAKGRTQLVGVFVDEMPQNVITYAYNYHLDYIQLHGQESPIYIDNLKRTLKPDILPEVKIIKAISIREADDVKRWREYQGHVDMLLFDTKTKSVGGSGQQFDWNILQDYDGSIPFLLSGGIGADDAESIKNFKHPMYVGIDINSRFETEPGVKDLKKIEKFIERLKN